MTVVHLHLLRHSDAGDPLTWPGPDDARPLSPEGIEQAARLGEHLAHIGFRCDAILSSPKRRAVETADSVAEALGRPVTIDERVAGPLTLGLLERVLEDAGSPRNPVLVGHDPDFSELLASLIGAVDVPMKKGALARLDVRLPMAPGQGRLRWLLPPDAISRR